MELAYALVVLLVVLLVISLSRASEGLVKSENQVVTKVSPYVLNVMQKGGFGNPYGGQDYVNDEAFVVSDPHGGTKEVTSMDLAAMAWTGA